MTFSEFKFKLKREGTHGPRTFYTVPKNDGTFIGNDAIHYTELPHVLHVDVTTNKNGKKILDFHTGGFGGNPSDVHFFFDKELADAYAVKLQVVKQTALIKALRDFEHTTKINARLDIYLDKYPEIFIWVMK